MAAKQATAEATPGARPKKGKPNPHFEEAKRRARGEVRLAQVHLNGEGFSWRGVQIRDLPPEERRRAERAAAKEAGQEATFFQLHDAIVLECLRRMIVAVTSEPVEHLDNGVRWDKHNLTSLSQPGVWDKLFTSKDDNWLRRYYQGRHEVDQRQIDMISGKVQLVATGD